MLLRRPIYALAGIIACAWHAGLGAQGSDPRADCRRGTYRAYDYALGSWHNIERVPTGTGELEITSTGESHIHEVAGGCGLVEHRTVYEEGRATDRLLFLRAYDHERDRWNQVLLTDFPAYMVWTVRRLGDGRTRFATTRILEGDTVRFRMTEEPLADGRFRRTFQRHEADGGAWSVDAVVDYTPIEGGATASAVGRAADEEAAVRAALQHYLDGHATGDGSHFRKVFHPESRLFWVRDGELDTRSSEAYIAGAPGEPAEDEAWRRRRIAMVDVTGDAAVARVELDYPGAVVTDYFSLLKVDGEWKIMNKIFHVRTRAGT